MDLDVSVTDSKGQPVTDLTARTSRFGSTESPSRSTTSRASTRARSTRRTSPTASPDRVLEVYKKGGDAFVPRHFLIYVDSGTSRPDVQESRARPVEGLHHPPRPDRHGARRPVRPPPQGADGVDFEQGDPPFGRDTMEKGVGMSRLQNQLQTMRQIDSTRSRARAGMLARRLRRPGIGRDRHDGQRHARAARDPDAAAREEGLPLGVGQRPLAAGLRDVRVRRGRRVRRREHRLARPEPDRVEIEDLAKDANADEVTFYTVDARGLTAGEGASASTDEPLAFRPGARLHRAAGRAVRDALARGPDRWPRARQLERLQGRPRQGLPGRLDVLFGRRQPRRACRPRSTRRWRSR